jgi:hypothetical protein
VTARVFVVMYSEKSRPQELPARSIKELDSSKNKERKEDD